MNYLFSKFFELPLTGTFENTAEKGEIARNEQFLLFPQCFLPFRELSAIFIKSEI